MTARSISFAALIAAPLLASASTEVSFLFCYSPDNPEDPPTRRILDLAKADPEIVPVKWGGLVLPGAGGRSTFMLALAGGTAPDIYKAWFHILRHDVSQGFVYPLDEWVDGLESWKVGKSESGERGAGNGERGRETLDDRRDAPPPRLSSRVSCPTNPNTQTPKHPNTSSYEACFDSPAALKAADFLQSLVRLDVVRGMPTLTVADDIGQLFVSGEIVAVFGGEDLVMRLTETLAMPPDSIGLMPFPAADDGGVRVLQAHRHFYAMSESVGRRPKEERDLVWKCLSTLASPELADAEVRRSVAEGRARWCRPADLERLGFTEELASVPKAVREMYADLDAGKIKAVTEPWVGFWQGASDLVQRRFLGLLLSDAGKTMDCVSALRSITEDANRGLMFDSDKSSVERARPYARMILGAFLSCALVAVWLVWRNGERGTGNGERGTGNGEREALDEGRKGTTRLSSHVSCQANPSTPNPNTQTPHNPNTQTPHNPNTQTPHNPNTRSLAPWLFLAPAILSILVWSYYPLVRGAVMAFQDYHIVGGSSFAGLDNFIRVATDPGFWAAWLRTLEYVAITLLLGFITPVVLAVMLCEIPRGKVFFRFLYFLPHLTSALVVTLLWKLMFDPTENGILNQILASVGIARHSWLQDPAWAMVCCIIPGVWAGAGISSLIYIAALGSLPQDYYEAAALDGAGILARFRHVTFPQLAPLMVINFVGAFIAAFQGMGSIFLLTFGGPGDATQVLSLQIWKEAYNNLRFSTATTMAWFLGVALIGFTYLQIRFLRRVEFRRAT